jgi:pectate lyase
MIVWLAVDTSPGQAAPGIPAFPGAEGFGACTPGGRYGRIVPVTTLDDYHPQRDEPVPGSLRWACTMPGPRIVIFRVSGTIVLKDKLVITEPFITIAGQSAPGGGICLRNGSMAIGDAAHPVRDVVLRHLRIRPGPEGPQHYNDVDALSIEHANNVIVDHCSLSWDVDETLAIKAAWWNTHGREYYQATHDITIQYCIISESLNRSRHRAHVKQEGEIGPHSKSLQIDGGANRVTLHHNLVMHGDMRNPLFPCEGDKPILVDFVNNVVYNFGARAAHTHAKTNHQVDMNFVGNWYIRGPNSAKVPSLVHDVDTRVYAKGNMGPFRAAMDLDEYAGIAWRGPRQREGLRAERRFDVAPLVTTHSYRKAYELILEHAGASLPRRDAVDRRLVSEVAERKGRIIDHPHDVGGWPRLESAAAPQDEDRDGMPDTWERAHQLDPADPLDHRNDADGDGYTNVEEWLNGTPPASPE